MVAPAAGDLVQNGKPHPEIFLKVRGCSGRCTARVVCGLVGGCAKGMP
jgi:hypothetical protein